MKDSSASRFKQVTLVSLQFISAGTLVLSSYGEILGHPIGLMVVIAGAMFGTWAGGAFGLRKITVLPQLRTDATLTVSGPYQYVRHPMYTAVLIFCGGFAVGSFVIWKLVVWCILLLVVAAKSQMEERYLIKRFEEYASYKRRTGRFVPRLFR